MKLATFNEMLKLCNNYDQFTQYIDNGRLNAEARYRNSKLDKRFNELMEQAGWKGYNRGVPMTGSMRTLERTLREWVWERDWSIDDDDQVERNGVHGVIRNYNGNKVFIPLW